MRRRLADLFAGLGALSLGRAGKLTLFESDRPAVAAVEAAARRLGGKVTVERRDLFRNPLTAAELDAFDAVLLDPPRAGAAAQSAELARAKVPRVVYASCDPGSFARDARTLQDGGYRLEKLLPIDQFLWSPHVELIALFARAPLRSPRHEDRGDATMMFDLTGKVAVVTGGSRGIGRSICEQMAAHGAKVVVSSRKLPACEEVVKGIKAKGGEATAVAASISDKAQLENLVAFARKTYGKIDIMVCNAASNPYFGPLTGLKEEVFPKIMQNNVMSNLWLMNMVGPEMAERKDGVFIIVSSIGALVGSAHIAAYNMSKAADLSLVKSLAMEWGKHNIRVNAIAPGLIQTDFAKALWDNPEIRRANEGKAALKRIGQPDDIGGVAVFLASKAGSFRLRPVHHRRRRRDRLGRGIVAQPTSSSHHTGTWSDGSGRPRSALSMPTAVSRSAACGDSSRWSILSPLPFAQAPAW